MIRIFHVSIPASLITLLILDTILISGSFVFAAYLTFEVDPTLFLIYEGGLRRILLIVAMILLVMYFMDFYSEMRQHSRLFLLQQLIQVAGVSFLWAGLLSYFSPDLRVPLRVMLTGGMIMTFVLFGWRLFYAKNAALLTGRKRVLLVGNSPLLEEVAAQIKERPELTFTVIGYVDDGVEPNSLRSGGRVLGPLTLLCEFVSKLAPDRVVVGFSERRHRLPVTDLLHIRLSGVPVEDVTSTYETICGRICTPALRPSQLIFSSQLGPQRSAILRQSIFNLVFAVLGVLASAPIMLLCALAVRLTSRGPIIYRQVRIGFNGRPFTLYKFRSMYVDAEARTGAVWAKKNDPRVTPVGRWLRKLRLDEMPQFFNVLRGEMSIVGPRPERPEFVRTLSELIAYYPLRHSVKPGITGWAQINYRYGDTIQDAMVKLEYDLYYIKNMSQALDTFIILRTIKTMLVSRSAQ